MNIILRTKQGNKIIPYSVELTQQPQRGDVLNLVVDLEVVSNLLKDYINLEILPVTPELVKQINKNNIPPKAMQFVDTHVHAFLATGRCMTLPQPLPQELLDLKATYDADFKTLLEEAKLKTGKVCTSCEQGAFIRRRIYPFLKFFYTAEKLELLEDTFMFFSDITLEDKTFITTTMASLHTAFQNEIKNNTNPQGCRTCNNNILNKYVALIKKLVSNDNNIKQNVRK